MHKKYERRVKPTKLTDWVSIERKELSELIESVTEKTLEDDKFWWKLFAGIVVVIFGMATDHVLFAFIVLLCLW